MIKGLVGEFVVVVCELYKMNCVCVCGGGGWGGGGVLVLALVWALIMHRVSSLRFASHWHGMGVHMHVSSHSGIAKLGGLLSKFLALIV